MSAAGRVDPGSRRDELETGFTLIEVVIAVTLLALIMGAITAALITSLKISASSAQRVKESNDVQLIAGFLVRDAQAAGGSNPTSGAFDQTIGVSINWLAENGGTDPDPAACRDTIAGDSLVARFAWNDRSIVSPDLHLAKYYYSPSSKRLTRLACKNGSLDANTTLGRNVITTPTAPTPPNASCSPGCAPGQLPKSVTFTAYELNSPSPAPYKIQLTTDIRTDAEPVPSSTDSFARPLIMLGSSGACTGGDTIGLSSGADLRVYGTAEINTSNTGSCDAASASSGASFEAGTASYFTGGSCVPSSGGTCPDNTSTYSPAIGDPFTALTLSTAGMSSFGTTGCPTRPGIYTNGLSISGSCQLPTGVYVIQGSGLSVSGANAHLTSAAGGVMLYIQTGSVQTGANATVVLAAQTTGVYAGLLIWQPASNNHPISFASNATLTLSGTIYAPSAQVNFSSNSTTTTVKSIVAKSISGSSNGAVQIGTPSPTPLSITSAPASLQPWTVGRAYPPTATLVASGGDGNYRWSATGLPDAMTINANTGVISGTPNAAGTTNIVVSLNDELGDKPDTQNYTLTINDAPAITTASPLPNGETTVPYSLTLAKSGGTGPYTWSENGTLPAGITFAAGTFSGKPTGAGTSTFTVTLSDAAGATTPPKTFSLTINPAPTITGVVLSGGTAGTIEKGDTIVVKFSGQMRVSSFCSTWNGDGSPQNITGNGVVTVVVTHGIGAAHDVVTVTTSSGCAFNFGNIDLGTNTYVTGNVTFSGNGANASTINWNGASPYTLTIKLGTKGGAGNVGTNQTSAPVYTAPGTIVDAAGVGLNPATFAVNPAAKQF